MTLDKNSSYNQLSPSNKLKDFIDSYWESKNLLNKPLKRTIFPDSFFKVVITIVEGKIIDFFITGIWQKEKEIVIPANSIIYGIKFKILAPEYIFRREIASLLQSQKKLDSNFWNISSVDFDSLQNFVNQIEPLILDTLKLNKEINKTKIKLSKLLYKSNGNILVKEISEQVSWSSREINRYFNKYLGLSLKAYLNIQKVYVAYLPIINKRFFPDKGFHDQSHFIREIKKHTNETPKKLEKQKDNKFIQLKNIKVK